MNYLIDKFFATINNPGIQNTWNILVDNINTDSEKSNVVLENIISFISSIPAPVVLQIQKQSDTSTFNISTNVEENDNVVNYRIIKSFTADGLCKLIIGKSIPAKLIGDIATSSTLSIDQLKCTAINDGTNIKLIKFVEKSPLENGENSNTNTFSINRSDNACPTIDLLTEKETIDSDTTPIYNYDALAECIER